MFPSPSAFDTLHYQNHIRISSAIDDAATPATKSIALTVEVVPCLVMRI